MSWTTPTVSGPERVCLLMVPACPYPESDALEQLSRRLGMRPGFDGRGIPAVVHLVGENSAVLAYGTDTIGPLTVPPGWTDLARRESCVSLLIAPAPRTGPVRLDAHLQGNFARVALSTVPVSNEPLEGR